MLNAKALFYLFSAALLIVDSLYSKANKGKKKKKDEVQNIAEDINIETPNVHRG